MSQPSRTRRPLVLAAVMTNMFMIAIEATIVSTAMPQIAGQLGDLHLYSWVFAAFLLTQAATTALFGKLADLYGRKPILMIGTGFFLLGSTLCGFAWSMPSMIAFRLLQGVGAGAIMPVNMTVVGDLYSAQERGRIQGWLASVWGASSLFGPLAGALIIQHVSWAWIFWINLPIGVAATAGFTLFLHETVAPGKRRVDVPGAILFAVAIAALMLALTELGTGRNLPLAGGAVVCVLAATAFVWHERRTREPMISFALWSRRPIATANAATLLSGMALIGLTTFLPMYVQGVLNRSALVAGFALTAMVLGWPIGSTFAAKLFPRIGLRSTLLFGAAMLPTGAVAFLLLHPGASPLVAGLGSAVMGLGMGFLSTAAIVIIQEHVGWAERGSATASNVLSRNIGSTLGATAFGGLLNLGLARHGATTSGITLNRSAPCSNTPAPCSPTTPSGPPSGVRCISPSGACSPRRRSRCCSPPWCRPSCSACAGGKSRQNNDFVPSSSLAPDAEVRYTFSMDTDPHSPAPTRIEALASLLLRLWVMLWGPAAELYCRLDDRLAAIGERISAIAEKVDAGTYRAPRARAQRPAKPRAPRSARVRLPRGYGWLRKHLAHDIGTDGGSLLDLIKSPRMQGLMAVAPEIGDLFREMLWATGALEEALPFLPPTRRERARLRDAAMAAEDSPALLEPDAAESAATPVWPASAPSPVHATNFVPDRPKLSKTAFPPPIMHVHFVTI